MDKDLIDFLITQGVFATLFIYLLFYVLKENNKREETYRKIITDFSSSLPDLKKDIEEIKNKIN